MNKVTLLPKWCFPGTKPSVYDTTSGTAIEMVAKLYNEISVLQETYNKFVDEINKTITEFNEGLISDFDEFKACITKIMHDYIIKIDEKIKMQDLRIEEGLQGIDDSLNDAINYMKTNIYDTTTNIIHEYMDNNQIIYEIGIKYVEEEEKLTIGTLANVEDKEY